MMKRLILIRHAKSSWKYVDLDDFDRPLNKRGKSEAPQMAQYLKQQNIPVHAVFSSSAKRAKKTAKFFATALNVQVQYLSELYLAEVEYLIEFIENKFAHYDSVGIVSHNPELTALQNFLCEEKIDNIPTSAYTVIECLDGELSYEGCKLVDFAYPKLLQAKGLIK